MGTHTLLSNNTPLSSRACQFAAVIRRMPSQMSTPPPSDQRAAYYISPRPPRNGALARSPLSEDDSRGQRGGRLPLIGRRATSHVQSAGSGRGEKVLSLYPSGQCAPPRALFACPLTAANTRQKPTPKFAQQNLSVKHNRISFMLIESLIFIHKSFFASLCRRCCQGGVLWLLCVLGLCVLNQRPRIPSNDPRRPRPDQPTGKSRTLREAIQLSQPSLHIH